MDIESDGMITEMDVELEQPLVDQSSLHEPLNEIQEVDTQPQPEYQGQQAPSAVDTDTAMDLDAPSLPRADRVNNEPESDFWKSVTESVRRYHDGLLQQDSP